MSPALDAQKVAIVTGASGGIGAGLAAAFRATGYGVVGTSRSMPSSDDPDVLTVNGDITRAETAERVVGQALDRFGRIDSLINMAGMYIGKPFTEYTPDDFAAITAVNLAGFFHITQRVIAEMVTQGSGHVVNMTTSLVDHADSKRPSALTSLTKGGLAAVTRALAIEHASRGVRVNAVARSSRTAGRSLGLRKECTGRRRPASPPRAGTPVLLRSRDRRSRGRARRETNRPSPSGSATGPCCGRRGGGRCHRSRRP
jgi:NAD(P)-dependent dehydrogenase (short-subunit alcohol dehydrogenase family)